MPFRRSARNIPEGSHGAVSYTKITDLAQEEAIMTRLYGRGSSGRYYPVQRPPRGLPAKPVLKLLLLLAVIMVIASFL